jgi:hypothetical protein
LLFFFGNLRNREPISFTWHFLELLERVARRTARRTSRRWGMMSQQGPSEEESPQYTQALPQEPEDLVKVLQGRLAKGEITPEQYQASLKVLQGS